MESNSRVSKYWSSKHVVVTGGAGFIGSAITRRLVSYGAKVRVIDNLSKESRLTNLSDVIRKIEFVDYDLTKPDSADNSLSDVDVCFNLAAKIGGITYFHRYPATSIRDNVLINLNLWEAAKKSKPKMVCVSSSMVFENTAEFPTPEAALYRSPPPITGYGFSKLAAEYIARTYLEEYEVPYVICRPFNAYGPGEGYGEYDGYAHVIPDLIRKIVQEGQDPVKIIGDGRQTRSFTYVEDIADAMLYIAEHASNDDFNIGTAVETSILDLCSMIWKMDGRKGDVRIETVQKLKYDVQRRVPDVSKLNALGWHASVGLLEGLQATIAYISNEQRPNL